MQTARIERSVFVSSGIMRCNFFYFVNYILLLLFRLCFPIKTVIQLHCESYIYGNLKEVMNTQWYEAEKILCLTSVLWFIWNCIF
jgi:hypothetical protein